MFVIAEVAVFKATKQLSLFLYLFYLKSELKNNLYLLLKYVKVVRQGSWITFLSDVPNPDSDVKVDVTKQHQVINKHSEVSSDLIYHCRQFTQNLCFKMVPVVNVQMRL